MVLAQIPPSNKFGTCDFIVDPTPGLGSYQTIGAALSAAVAGQTIFIRPGTYTENLTLKAGVNLVGYPADADSPIAQIVGKISASYSGSSSISGIRLDTNSDYCLSVTGSSTALYLESCLVISVNNNAVNVTNGLLYFYNCEGSNQSSSYNIFNVSGGLIQLNNFIGAVKSYGTIGSGSVISGGTIAAVYTIFNESLSSSSAGYFELLNCEVNGALSTSGTSSTNTAAYCTILGGVSVGTGTVLSITDCILVGVGTGVSGGGALQYNEIKYGAGVVNTNTNTSLQTGVTDLCSVRMNAGQVVHTTTPGSYPYTALSTDYVILASSSSAHTIKLPNAPTTGCVYIIKDVTGNAATDNITVTTVGGVVDIDGATTYVMNNNYQANGFVFNGTQWNIFDSSGTGGGGGGGITTIDGDVGSVTGTTISLLGATGSSNSGVGSAGSSVTFQSQSSTEMDLFLSDNNQNTLLGAYTGNSALGFSGNNTGVGFSVLVDLVNGSDNTGIGLGALASVTTGQKNNALGSAALQGLVNGSNCIGIGYQSGALYVGAESNNICLNHIGVTSENNTLRIGAGTGTGTQQLNTSFICGINGISVTGSPVLVSSGDQLGITVSSRRFKDNIEDMSDTDLLSLRPVNFTYKSDPDATLQYGLIAEEVAEIMPELVAYDQNGDPLTVHYHLLPSLLLQELKKALKRIEALEEKLK